MSDNERAMRFGYLMSEIEVGAEKLRLGLEEDIMLALGVMNRHLIEANALAAEVSRETLDQVTSQGSVHTPGPVIEQMDETP